jgi:hypothetical protein
MASSKGFDDLPLDHLVLTESISEYSFSLPIVHSLQLNNVSLRRTKELGLPSSVSEFLTHNVEDMKAVTSAMRNVFYSAAGISPLVILLPHKACAESLPRDHLLAVRIIHLM